MTSPARQSNHLCESRGEYRSNSSIEALFLSLTSMPLEFYDLPSSNDPLAMCRRTWIHCKRATVKQIESNRL